MDQHRSGEKIDGVYNNYQRYAVDFDNVAKQKKPLFVMNEIVKQYDDLVHLMTTVS